jgi:hypothetical protein
LYGGFGGGGSGSIAVIRQWWRQLGALFAVYALRTEGLPMNETKIAIYIPDTIPVNALIAVAKGWWERWL